MKTFRYLEPATLRDAAELKRRHPSSVYIAGGTDVTPLMKYDLLAPEAVISLARLPELAGIEVSNGNLEIGGLVRLHQLHRYASAIPALAGLGQAARLAASPQIRRLGSVAGNLLQCRRCYYYNQTGAWRAGIRTCLKNGGDVCHQAPAKKLCQAAHYSDLAPPLLAAGAEVELFRGEKNERVPMSALWNGTPPAYETALLAEGALMTKIVVPDVDGLKRLFFRKRAARAAIDFPLANAALAVRNDGRARLVLGAMSPAALFLEETAAEISDLLAGGRDVPEEIAEHAEKEARKKMRPAREAAVSAAVKLKAMGAVLREAVRDLRRSLVPKSA